MGILRWICFVNSALVAVPVMADPRDGLAEQPSVSFPAVGVFLTFVLTTLAISYWASKRTRSSSAFYNAGGKITGLQNGTAIAGDFMSAASFLGITALFFSAGFDGFIFSLGAFSAWPIMLFLLARRLRNLGSFTFIDVVSERLDRHRIRYLAITSSIVVVVLYLIAQMVGAGKLIELLFGLPYETALVTVSVLVLIYVGFGGMLATTWVQIVKAILLMAGVTVLAALVMVEAEFSLEALLRGATENHPRGSAVLMPGGAFSDPVQVATILVSMLFGVLGLPHILMRLFTVPSVREAKQSTFFASLFMGYFYLLLLIVGFGAAFLLYGNPEFFDDSGQLIGGGNMTAIHLADLLGGDLLKGFMSAVSFATILAVVAGLTVSGAAAISHDLYAEVICRGEPDPAKELVITRISTVVIAMIAVLLGMAFEDENVAFIATMPMVVAASTNFPILFLSLYWNKLTTNGAVAGALVGLLSSVALIVAGPQVWVSVIGFADPLFPYDYPALFTMPSAFLIAWLVSNGDRTALGEIERTNYAALEYRAEFGSATDGPRDS